MPGIEISCICRPALEVMIDILKSDDAGIKFLSELLQFLALFNDRSFIDFTNDLPGLCEKESGLEVSKSMSQLYNLGFVLIQLDIQDLTEDADVIKTFAQHVLGLMDQISIVHVPAIMLDAQLLLDVMIHGIR